MAYPQTATIGSGSYNQAMTTAPTPITPMQEARQSLTGAVNLIHDRLEQLERRLETVLRPAQPQPGGTDSNKIAEVPSEHRQFLSITTNELHGAATRLDSLLSRLEL